MTVTAAVASSEPEVAVIVAVPFAIAVTSPADETVATAASDEAQLIVGLGLGIALPPASHTVPTIVLVSPIDEKLKLVGARVIDPAT